MVDKITIRRARREDVPQIMDIYNYAIINTTSTFDTEPKTLENRLKWFAVFNEQYPLLVAVIDKEVVGWGSIRSFGTRNAYRYTVENAIYIKPDYQGKGIGSRLLYALITIAQQKKYHAILALIVGGNEASERLHLKFGFEQVGVMREVGRKFDRWLDILIFEKILNS